MFADVFSTARAYAVISFFKALQRRVDTGEVFERLGFECCDDLDVAKLGGLFCRVGIQRFSRMIVNCCDAFLKYRFGVEQL